MRALAARPRFSAALAATVLAASAAVGAVSAAAAPVAPGQVEASPMTWHPLTLLHGWASASSQSGSGNPAWALSGGVVYLSGSIRQVSGSSTEFAVLPAAERPAHYLFLNDSTLNGTTGYLTIYPDGKAFASSSPAGDARGRTSLAAVSWPARSMPVRRLHLRNGWRSDQAYLGTGDPSWAVRNDVVYLSGSLHQPLGSRKGFAVLPRAARPRSILYITVASVHGKTAVLRVYPDGHIWAYSGTQSDARVFTSLAGVSYPAATAAAQPLQLLNGWQLAGPSTGNAAYHLRGGVVYLSGAVSQPSPGSDIVAQLPATARPSHVLYVTVGTWECSLGTLQVNPDGTVLVTGPGPPTGAAQIFTSLAAVSFPVSS